MTIGFWRIATADPDRVAIIDADGVSCSYGELLARSRAISAGLRSLGVQRGDGVSMILPNHPAFFELLLATMEAGIYLTPVNSHLAAPEIEYVVADSEAKVVVAHEALAAVCRAAVEGCGVAADRRFAVGRVEGFRPYDELLGSPASAPPDRSPGGRMMYTSGTTGKPRGVRYPLTEGDPDDVYGAIAEITCQGFGIPADGGTHLVCGPLYHAGPFVGAVNSIHVGKTIVLMDRWTPESFLELVERYQVDSTQMVPTMFHRLLALPEEVRHRYDISSLRSVFHTGAPCPPEVKQRIMDWWGPVVYETYGGTEGAATIATPRRWLERPGTVGKAIHGVTVRILDDNGDELPHGETGDIWIDVAAGPPSEYFKDPEKTSRMRRGRMVTLGDIGYLDEDGFLFLRDRKIDMIISGGVNIYPAEVEAALLSAPEVADAVVIGVPDPEWGEQVKAIVEPQPGVAPTSELAGVLIDHCRSRIAGFKLPRSVDFVERLPRLPNGKVEKRRLRDPYWAARDTAI
ncbi:MAG TPA: AMP-binding protein [Acidimicrobiales bacterium]|nr:AMP-binding protein [Acidimicrobiales bacterium]